MLVIKPDTPIDARLEMYRGLAVLAAVDSDPLLMRFAAQIADANRTNGREHLAQTILRMVQGRRLYRRDPPGPDTLYLPGEVLGSHGAPGGDCEDLAVLVGALARALGVRFRLVWLDRSDTGNPQSHVTVQLSRDGGSTFEWAEPCIDDAAFGEHPLDAAARVRSALRARVTG